MGRVLKILLYAIVLFMIYLWFSTMFKSCNKKAKNITDSVVEVVDDTVEAGEDLFGEEDIDYTEEEPEDDSDEVEYLDDETDEDQEEPDDDVDFTEEPEDEPVIRNSSSSNGSYYVIAGSYLIEANAIKMERKLENIGYDNAEVVVFDLSQYHSIIAGRYDSRSSAQNTCDDLKGRGIDCYVQRRR